MRRDGPGVRADGGTDMKVKTVKRYYCEFCKKGGQSASHISRHEKGCTANPNRVCGLCKEVGEDQAPMSVLMDIMAKAQITKSEEYGFLSATLHNEKEIIKALEEATGNCPACMLAAIRQSKYAYLFNNFDFKQRQGDFWTCVNDSRNERGGY